MAALRMILLAYTGAAPSVTELLILGVERGFLTEKGWLHAGIAKLATGFGVPARAEPVATKDLTGALATAPLIISITEQFPDDGRHGGHLVIARGYTDDGPDPDILIRDPSAWGQKEDHDRVPLSRVARSYTGRAVTFAPLPSGRATP